jgi:hypothetical protein
MIPAGRKPAMAQRTKGQLILLLEKTEEASPTGRVGLAFSHLNAALTLTVRVNKLDPESIKFESN